jgi:diacylglycerol kinase (ATP)
VVETLIIINPHAGGRATEAVWRRIAPHVEACFGPYHAIVSEQPGEVAAHLAAALADGLARVITLGGDGTNHVVINALLRQDPPMARSVVYGNIPVGTGRDWARAIGAPTDPIAAVDWLARATPRPVDLGRATIDGQVRYFLNIASTGISGEVDARVNRIRRRRSWTFLGATLGALMRYQPQPLRLIADGKLWHEGPIYLVAAANGTTFGHGMRIAPQARFDDGALDLVLIEELPRIEALLALRLVFSGTHLRHPAVRWTRARSLQIEPLAGELHLDFDGEYIRGQELTIDILPARFLVLLAD